MIYDNKNIVLCLKLSATLSGYISQLSSNNFSDKNRIAFLQSLVYKENSSKKDLNFLYNTFLKNNVSHYNGYILNDYQIPSSFEFTLDKFVNSEFSEQQLKEDSNTGILNAKVIQWTNRLTKHLENDIKIQFSESSEKYNAFYRLILKTPEIFDQINEKWDDEFDLDYFIERGLDTEEDEEIDKIKNEFTDILNSEIKNIKKHKGLNISKHEMDNFLQYCLLNKLKDDLYICKALETKNLLSKNDISKDNINFYYRKDSNAEYEGKTHTKVLGIALPEYSEPIEIHVSDDIFENYIKTNNIPETNYNFYFKPGLPYKLNKEQLDFLDITYSASRNIDSMKFACGMKKIPIIEKNER